MFKEQPVLFFVFDVVIPLRHSRHHHRYFEVQNSIFDAGKREAVFSCAVFGDDRQINTGNGHSMDADAADT